MVRAPEKAASDKPASLFNEPWWLSATALPMQIPEQGEWRLQGTIHPAKVPDKIVRAARDALLQVSVDARRMHYIYYYNDNRLGTPAAGNEWLLSSSPIRRRRGHFTALVWMQAARSDRRQ